MDEYIKTLKTHDWFYDRSDDHRVWKKGQEVRAQLNRMQKALDPAGLIWNQHCPPEYIMRVTQKRLDEIEAGQKPELTVEEMYPGCNKKMLDVLRKVVENDRR